MVTEASIPLANSPRLLSQLSPGLVDELRAYLAENKRRIEGGSEQRGTAVARSYAKLYDGVLSSLFGACHGLMSQRGQWPVLSLAAVGSYGRRTLAPFSDLDVRITCAGDPSAAAPAAEALLYPLWDSGLNIGHQVVTLDDVLALAQHDITTATTLLDWRWVAGDPGPCHALLERAHATIFTGDNLAHFIRELEARTSARHQRFGDSVYLLEPDVKNGAGGLRDLDIAHWCARARYRVDDLGELCGLGVLSPREWAEVERARNLLLEIRHALHQCTGRRSDRLTFELQERVTGRLRGAATPAAAEQLMSDYYRAARAVRRCAEMLLARARSSQPRPAAPVPIADGLVLVDGAVALESAKPLSLDPALAFRLYAEAVARGLPVAEASRQELMRVTTSPDFLAALAGSSEARALFLELCQVVQQTALRQGSVLVDLHEVGLLVAMIPEFAPVVGRVHRDTYHVYTVDVHSVAAVDHLRALCRGELSHEHPLASRLAAELPRRRVLFLAALLHDIGKAYGGAGHTTRGVAMAAEILERLGLPPGDRAEVQLLIKHHLSMYQVATRRDLEDPRTLREFCANVRERESLRELYLLTIADVTTTNPTSMTTWKRRMLDGLFVAADRKLAGDSERVSSRTASVRERVLGLWGRERDRSFIEHFVTGMPERYYYANEPEVIVEHALFAETAAARPCSVRKGAVSHPYFELWVVADDRPGLLAMITATVSHAKLKVRSAQVYSWIGRDGRSRCLDIFWLRGPEDSERAARLLRRLERELEDALSGALPADELERRALRTTRSDARLDARFATEVHVDNESASNYTIVEIVTQDRPALLYCLSSALQGLGLSIWFAKINTEGERVIDVFYVSNGAGQKVIDPCALERMEAAILDAIVRLEELAKERGSRPPRGPDSLVPDSLPPDSSASESASAPDSLRPEEPGAEGHAHGDPRLSGTVYPPPAETLFPPAEPAAWNGAPRSLPR